MEAFQLTACTTVIHDQAAMASGLARDPYHHGHSNSGSSAILRLERLMLSQTIDCKWGGGGGRRKKKK